MLEPWYCLPMRRAAGEFRLRFCKPGRVRDTGVVEKPGVGGTEAGLWTAECDGVDSARMLRPPHLTHFSFSLFGVDAEASAETLLRRPLRLG